MKSGGSSPRTQAESLPSAASAATWRRMYSRSRMVAATVSSSSARLPPTWRWIRIAITTQAKSLLWKRSATPSSASSRLIPSRVSTSTRRNSPAIGSCPSFTTVSIDWARDRPAASEPEISCSVSGSRLSNFFRRRPRLKPRYHHGPTAPIARKMMPRTRLPPPSSSPTTPIRMKIPTWTSSHSAGLKGLPAPSSRSSIRVSSPLLALSTFSAVWVACSSASPLVSSPRTPALLTRSVYAVASSAPVSGFALRGASMTSTTTRPSPSAASPAYRNVVFSTIGSSDSGTAGPAPGAASPIGVKASAVSSPCSEPSVTATVASAAVTVDGTSAVTSTCRASTSAWSLKAAARASGSALIDSPPPAAAISSSAAGWSCSSETTLTWTSLSVTAAVRSSSGASLVSAPSESTSSWRWPSVPAMSMPAETPS